MTVFRHSDTAPIVRGHNEQEAFNLSSVANNVATGEQLALTPTVKDITYAAHSGAGTRYSKNITSSYAANVQVPVFSSLTENVCTVDQSGAVTPLTNGTCTIQARNNTGTKAVTFSITSDASAETIYDSVTGYATGSLRKYLYDQQIAALAVITPGAAAQHDQTWGIGEANPNMFLYRTGVAGFTALPLDALKEIIISGKFHITPRHYIQAAGHDTSSTDTYKFINFNSQMRYHSDEWTGSLCKILPDNFRTKLPDAVSGDNIGTSIPVWARLYNTYGESTSYWTMPVNFNTGNPFPVGDSRRAYQRFSASPETMATGGDSNSPVFCGINGELIFLSHVAYYSRVGDVGVFTESQINTAISELSAFYGYGTPQTVGVVDLSGFNSY